MTLKSRIAFKDTTVCGKIWVRKGNDDLYANILTTVFSQIISPVTQEQNIHGKWDLGLHLSNTCVIKIGTGIAIELFWRFL